MTPLDTLLIVAAATVVVLLFIGHLRIAGWIASALYAVQFGLLIGMTDALHGPVASTLSITVFDQTMTWRYDALSWFFALITIGSGLATAIYMAGIWIERYAKEGNSARVMHTVLALNVVTILVLIGSGDYLSLFVGWELVSWAGFVLMALAGGIASQAALRYLTYAMAGAMAILGAMALLYGETGSLEYAALVAALPDLTDGQIWTLLLLFGAGFAVKLGLVPFHLWQAQAYSETPAPGAIFLGAVAARTGLYAIIVVIIQGMGVLSLRDLAVPFTFLDGQLVIAWIAAATMIIPTYAALKQNDARYLLAWHGIGQGGYMLLGLVVGSPLAVAGGLLHVFNYAITQLPLLMVVFAVMYRTGTADLNKLGGLVARMPLSFLVLLFGIVSLAGLPPMSGFVSKWMIYRSLITEGMPLLFVAAVIATLGTILSVYKLIHNMFLGQLRVEHVDVREVPPSMLIPMLAMAAILFIYGFMPGLALQWIAAVQEALGLAPVSYILGGIDDPKGGLDMLWLVGILFAGTAVSALIFYGLAGRSRRVHQLDNYAGGHFLTAETRYQYSDNFYAGAMQLIGSWYRGSFEAMEKGIAEGVGLVAHGMEGVYRAAQPALLMLLAAALAVAWVLL